MPVWISPLSNLALSPTTVTGGWQSTELLSSEWEAVKYSNQWVLRDTPSGTNFNMKSNCQAVAVKTLRSSTETEWGRGPGPSPTLQIFCRLKGACTHQGHPSVSAPTLLLPVQASLCLHASILQILTIKQKNNKWCPCGLNVGQWEYSKNFYKFLSA